MGIIAIVRDDTGKQGITPGRVLLTTTDTLATITTAGYLNVLNMQGTPLYPSDVLQVLYSFNLQTNKGTYGVFIPTYTNGVITLTSTGTSLGNPTVAGDFAVFSNTIGGLQDSGFSPADANKTKVVMAGNVGQFVTGNTLLTPQTISVINATVAFSDLSTAGQKVILSSSGSAQYQILGIYFNGLGNTNWTTGNRSIILTDGTTTFASTPTGSLTTLANAVWGATALTAPTSGKNFSTLTAAGANLVAQYSGGTTDYDAGTAGYTLIVAQVA